MSDFPPKRPSVLAPGMSQPVVAGEVYEIQDDKGDVLEIVGKDDPVTLEVIFALDSYILTDATLPDGPSPIRDAAWQAVRDALNNLPLRVMEQLPSVRAGGIVIPGQL